MPLGDQSHKENISQAWALLSSSVGECWELGILHNLWEAAQAQRAARADTWQSPPPTKGSGRTVAGGGQGLGVCLTPQHRSSGDTLGEPCPLSTGAPVRGKSHHNFAEGDEGLYLRRGRFISHCWGGGWDLLHCKLIGLCSNKWLQQQK